MQAGGSVTLGFELAILDDSLDEVVHCGIYGRAAQGMPTIARGSLVRCEVDNVSYSLLQRQVRFGLSALRLETMADVVPPGVDGW